MIINKTWAMPNKETFSIKPIKELIQRHIGGYSIDPFARNSWAAKVTNDLDPQTTAMHHMDALEFLKTFAAGDVGTMLFDPPYSPRQVSECYRKLGRTVSMQDTQAKFWGDLKREAKRIIMPGGKVISFGWNSGGMGKSNGFEQIEILLVAHGGYHNDTICVVEVRQ